MWANRQRGLQVTEEGTCRAEGLSLKEFWDFTLKGKIKASDFKRILYEGFLSPRGWGGPFLFDTIVSQLLREALEVGETWVSSPPQGQGGEHGELIVRRPREAIEWILERREDLIPPNLRAYVKGIVEAEQAPARPEAEQVESQKPHAGGRLTYLSKEVIAEEVFRLMDYHDEFVAGDPEWDCRARLEDAIGNFYQLKIGKRPAKSTIQENIRKPLARWRKVKAGN
jgi:hypothetical protein